MAEQSATPSPSAEAARQDFNRRVRRTEQAMQPEKRNGNPSNPVGEIAAMLRGEEVEARRPVPTDEPQDDAERDEATQVVGDDDDAAEGSQDEPQADDLGPGTLDDVAKKLGLTKGELNAVEVAVGHERMTLGELKAKLPELAKLDKSRAEYEERKGEWELKRIDSIRRISAILGRFPRGALPAQVLDAIDADHAFQTARESERLTTARKEWADPVYAATERQRMTALAIDYGFNKFEVAAMMDHREVLLLQDFAVLKAKFDTLKAQARRAENPDIGAGRGEGAPQSGPRRLNTRADLASRVGAILRR